MGNLNVRYRFFTSTSQGTLESPMPVIEAPKSQDVSCQTKLSFPPFLPETIEAELEALSMRLTGGSAAEAMDESLNTLNSSNCSARRKILSVEVEPPSDELQSDSSDEVSMHKCHQSYNTSLMIRPVWEQSHHQNTLIQ